MNDGEEIGRVGGRCIAMRIGIERKNGNGKRERRRMDWKSVRERCIAMRMEFERKNGNGKRERRRMD